MSDAPATATREEQNIIETHLSLSRQILPQTPRSRRAREMTPAQEQFLLGLRSLVRGVRYVASSRELLAIVVPRTLVSLVACLLVALAVWSPCLLLRLPPMRYAVPFEAVLEPTALVVLRLAQQLVPSRAHRGSFFAALDARAPGVACGARAQADRARLGRDRLGDRRGRRGGRLGDRPVRRGRAGVAARLVPRRVGVVPRSARARRGRRAALAWCCAPALRASSFALHWFTSPLAFALFVAVFFGVLRAPPRSRRSRARRQGGAWSLAPRTPRRSSGVRLPHDGWKPWTHEQRFVLCGFGFPLFLVSRLTHPIVGLALLEALRARPPSCSSKCGRPARARPELVSRVVYSYASPLLESALRLEVALGRTCAGAVRAAA